MAEDFHEPVVIAIDGTLDLHHFLPKDLKHLIPDYLEECRNKGIFTVRIVHGKGSGALRRFSPHNPQPDFLGGSLPSGR